MDRIIEIHRDSQLGLQPYYYQQGGPAHAPGIATLFAGCPALTPRLDPEGLQQYFARKPDGRRTCFAGVSKVPMHHRLTKDGDVLSVQETSAPSTPPLTPQRLLDALTNSLELSLSQSRRPVLALSGGLDSALLLALCQRIKADVPVVTLATALPGYCEREITIHTARSLGCEDVLVIEAGADQFLQALPGAIAACETPLYNLHPVSKWLLATELQQRGFDLVITGDGADQILTGADPRNYLPIVGAMTRAAGLAMACPFLNETLAAWARSGASDPDKSLLRTLASDFLAPGIAQRPKQPCFAPDFDLSIYRVASADAELGALLRREQPPKSPSPENTLWATATLLYGQLGGLG